VAWTWPYRDTASPPTKRKDGNLAGGENPERGAPETGAADEVLLPYKGGWSIVGPDGITETGITTAAAYGCADSQIPRGRAPSSHYAYKVAFDARNTGGTLRYQVGSVINSWKF
jgi:hypothetical protein